MALLKKIKHGFVVQIFDTDKQAFISQKFVAGDCEYEPDDGATAESSNFFNFYKNEVYLPFEMKQPE